MEAFFRTANYPLVERSDMSAEVREEALDVCLLACEKHSADMEKCTQVIKEQLDKKLGAPWHVVAGQHYAYEVTHECRNMLHVFIGGKLGVLCWKT